MLGPVEVAGHRTRDERSGRRDDPQTLGQIRDVAVAVGLHPGGPRGDPAAERRMGERVGEVAERVPAAASCSSRCGPKTPAWTRARPRAGVDLEHLVQRVEVDRDDRRLSVRAGSSEPEIDEPAAERDHDRVEANAAWSIAATWSSVAGRTTTSGTRGRSPARCRIEIAQRLPAPVHDAVERIGRDELRADGLLRRAAQRQPAARDPGSGADRSPERRRPPLRNVFNLIASRMNGARAGLSSCVNSIPS